MVDDATSTGIKPEKKPAVFKKEYIFAVGRRRGAVARARLYPKAKDGLVWGETQISQSQIYVNEKPISEYFGGKVAEVLYNEPFKATNTLGKFTTTVKVVGGGTRGQLNAVIYAIAKALDETNPEKFHTILKKKGFLSRDSRVRQRRKVGMGGKSRRKKQSPKR